MVLDKAQQFLSEGKNRLVSSSENRSSAKLCQLIALTASTVSDFDLANTMIDRALKAVELNSALHIEILLTRVKTIRYQDSKTALRLLHEAEKMIKDLEEPSSELLTWLHAEYALCLTLNSDFENCLTHQLVVLEKEIQSANKAAEIRIRCNIAINRYDLGMVSESLKEIKTLIPLTQRFSLKWVEKMMLNIMARHLVYQGKYQEAEKLWNQILPHPTASATSSNEWLIQDSTLWALPMMQKYTQTIQGLDKFLLNSFTKQNKERTLVAKEMKLRLENLLTKNFGEIIPTNLFHLSNHLNSEDKALLYNFYLETHWMNFAPTTLGKKLDFSEKELKYGVSVPYKMLGLCLTGLHRLLEGEVKTAEDLLSRTVEFFKDAQFFIWEIRTLLGLSIIDLHHHRIPNAFNRLLRIQALLPQINSGHEKDLGQILSALTYLKDGKQSQFEVCLNEIPKDSPYTYFQQILEPYRMSKKEDVISIPTETHQRQFFDRIISLVGLDFLAKVCLKTRQTNATYFKSNLPNLSKDYDLVFDEIEHKVCIGKVIVPLRDKEILGNLLKFFLHHPQQIFSKEELTVHIWHEKYNPLVHDSRIYTSIKRLRALIEPALKKEIIITDEGQYGLIAAVRYALISKPTSSSSLSERQMWIMKYIETNQTLDRLTAQKLLKTSRTPIMNEIKGLIGRGLIKSIGNGKLVKYQKAS